jgi:pimeloyl-ACP methyl ester carboxylesterase
MKTTIHHLNFDYRDQGTGEPLIFLHAFPLNQTMWDEQVAALSHHCRVITLDLRGFGESDVAEGPATMEQMAADVRSLMSALDIERATPVGLSMGGYVALAFYREYPDAVRALVLADTRASSDTHTARERRRQSAEKAERQGATAIADDMVPLLLGKTTQATRPDIAARVRAMIEGNSPQGIADAQRGMAARRDSTYILAAIDFPTLILVGAEDELTPVAEAEALRDGIRGARLQVIEGAGHLSNVECPQSFNAALIEFVESLAAE